MEYVDYMLESEDSDNEVLGDWGEVEAILEETVHRDKVRVSERVRQVYDELESRREVFEDNRDEIEQRIKNHESRLENAQRKDEQPVREKLMQLRDLKLQERKQYWRDVQDLKEELRVLLEKLDELDDSSFEEFFTG
ncbi:hypothetical protein [Haloarcula vallismortis]|uniref:hypothetical protein n=1 Tax=Haloarcula vallismortis TaxID=28442 RepID=UPI0003265D99|nr:hypothetical protein [Haloarcula vallismortis]